MIMSCILLLPPSRRDAGHGPLPLLGFDELLLLLAVLRAIWVVDFERHVAVGRLAAERTEDLLAAQRAHLGNIISFAVHVLVMVLHDGIGVMMVRMVTNRRILRDVFDVSGGLGDLFLEGVAVDAGGGGGLAVLAGAAGEHEHVT
jgi:hypothetical protein